MVRDIIADSRATSPGIRTQRVLIQGDYAEDDDIPGWKGPRLSKLYRAMRPVDERKPK